MSNPFEAETVIDIFPQLEPHDSARIRLNPEGARVLCAAIEVAAQSQGTVEIQVFSSDGEGYTLSLTCQSYDPADPVWQGAHYTDYPPSINREEIRNAH